MKTRLTLHLDNQLIERARDYAARRGTSVSQLVADLFQSLPTQEQASQPSTAQAWRQELAPISRSLVGCLTNTEDLDEEDVRRRLEEKHR